MSGPVCMMRVSRVRLGQLGEWHHGYLSVLGLLQTNLIPI